MPSIHCLIHGRVQGVGFRYFVGSQAKRLGLSGWVRNLPTGEVELGISGTTQQIETMIERLKMGPRLAHVDRVDVDWSEGEAAEPEVGRGDFQF